MPFNLSHNFDIYKTCRVVIISALCELFDKADTGGDGTISIPEYMAMCEEYGIELTEEHIQTVKAIANDNGEVRGGPCFNVANIR